jgi:hypothetical protein
MADIIYLAAAQGLGTIPGVTLKLTYSGVSTDHHLTRRTTRVYDATTPLRDVSAFYH